MGYQGRSRIVNIYITMKDGRKLEFKHTGRAGGSYTKRIRYEGNFAIVTDEYYNETAIPSADILEIQTEQPMY